jgi:hypothetical protein
MKKEVHFRYTLDDSINMNDNNRIIILKFLDIRILLTDALNNYLNDSFKIK